MKQLKIFFILAISLTILDHAIAQNKEDNKSLSVITLPECYNWARENYPLIAKLDLLEKSKQYSLSNASKGYLPQINIYGQATYQSEVTELPVEIPNFEIPTIDKDQYKIYGEVYQSLSNFSAIKTQKEQISLNSQIEQQRVEIDLYQLKDRINQIYFGLLLIEVKEEQLNLIQADIDSTLSKLDAAIQNGTATIMDKQLLEVERISVGQERDENSSNKIAFLKMLAALTGQSIDRSTALVQPSISPSKSLPLNRPELNLFALQRQLLTVQRTQIGNRNIPNFGFFFQGGYGRPALNFLSNEFTPYYITGLKFSWNLSQRYTAKNDKQQLAVQGLIIDEQKETFLLNNAITQSQQSTEIDKYDQLIASDNEVLRLRDEIKNTAEVQLTNGLITTIDYIKILNDSNRAQQQLKLHEIMRLQAQYNLLTTTGN